MRFLCGFTWYVRMLAYIRHNAVLSYRRGYSVALCMWRGVWSVRTRGGVVWRGQLYVNWGTHDVHASAQSSGCCVASVWRVFPNYMRYVRITCNIMRFKAFSFLLLAITPPYLYNVVYWLNLAYLGIHPARCHIPTPPRVRQQRPKPTHFQIFFIFIFFCKSPCTLRFGLSRFSFVLSEFCVSCGKL